MTLNARRRLLSVSLTLVFAASPAFADSVFMPCKALSVKVDKQDPTRAAFSLSCAPTSFVFQIPFGPNSPLENGFGASLYAEDLVSNVVLVPPSGLSPSHWKALGDPPGIKGYRYHDAATCKSIKLDAKGLKMKCTVLLFGGTLPAMGDVAIRLLFPGGDPVDYCAQIGGEETRNDERMLKRKDSLAPVACLVP